MPEVAKASAPVAMHRAITRKLTEMCIFSFVCGHSPKSLLRQSAVEKTNCLSLLVTGMVLVKQPLNTRRVRGPLLFHLHHV